MHCSRPIMCQPVVHPTKCNVVESYQTYVVPHIHPVKTIHQTHNVYQHKHYCPHEVEHTCDTAHQHMDCCGDHGHHGHHDHYDPWL
jgi:spore coat protein D